MRFLSNCSDTLLMQRSVGVWMHRVKHEPVGDTIGPISLFSSFFACCWLCSSPCACCWLCSFFSFTILLLALNVMLRDRHAGPRLRQQPSRQAAQRPARMYVDRGIFYTGSPWSPRLGIQMGGLDPDPPALLPYAGAFRAWVPKSRGPGFGSPRVGAT